MIRAIPSAVVMYGLFASGLVAATFPAWRWLFFGFNFTLDELLQLRCFGL
jgi:hypothetical protein